MQKNCKKYNPFYTFNVSFRENQRVRNDNSDLDIASRLALWIVSWQLFGLKEFLKN